MPSKLCVSAPGKIILHGEHSVVHKKKAIACAIGSRVTVTASVLPNLESTIILDMPSIGLEQTTVKCDNVLSDFDQENFESAVKSIEQLCVKVLKEKDATDFMRLALSCLFYAYCKAFSNAKSISIDGFGISLVIDSDLPIGAGLGSSAAFNTSVACTFLILSKSIILPKSCEDFCEITNKIELDKINSLAFELEKIVHKTPSGIDNSIATFGGAVSFQDGVVQHIDKMPILQLLIVDTKIPRSTKTLVSKVKNYLNTFPSVVSPILDAMHSIASTAEGLLQKLYDNNDKIQLLEDWGKLVVTNQNLLASIGVSHSELDKICSIAQKYGCPAKLTGAGGGGCAIIFLDILQDRNKTVDLENELVSQGYDCIRANLGGPGVLVKSCT